ncbi:MAG: glycosyltransferase family 4 protein [Chlorobi bacterium]|nr:glycosyltransferase family 4 protein [Chlorobiota bacterium]
MLQSVYHDPLVDTYRLWKKAQIAFSSLWSPSFNKSILKTIREENVDIVHVHNFFPFVPVSGLREASRYVPVVMTLHNYRLICPQVIMFRDGKPCTECLGRAIKYPALKHACYRNSLSATIGHMLTLQGHAFLKTWSERITIFIALSEYQKSIYITEGFDEERIVIKPNFVAPDPGCSYEKNDFACFVGRLSPEKGIDVLFSAGKHFSNIHIYVAGEEAFEMQHPGCDGEKYHLLGKLPREDVFSLLQKARFLVYPSLAHEGLSMTIIEAFACGTPVIVSSHGSSAEIVDDGRTGLHFRPGDARDLADKIKWAWDHPEVMIAMGKEARKEYELKYTGEKNVKLLLDIYDLALRKHRAEQ